MCDQMRVDNAPAVNSKTRRAKLTTRGRLRVESARVIKRKSEQTKVRKAEKRRARLNNVKTTQITPISKNRLLQPATPKAKFRKRQRFKAWLPTHLFHAKRAHMTASKEPLWRMAIPLSPTQRCYRPTHRAANTRGGMAWDASYMSTLGLRGREAGIMGILKGLGVDAATTTSSRSARWLSGTRVWEGWVFHRDLDPSHPIAPVSILWQSCAQHDSAVEGEAAASKKSRRQALLRVHPSAFLELWEELLKLAKTQKPTVSVEDLRFEVGSIELVGPATTEALVGTLWSMQDNAASEKNRQSSAATWAKLRSINSPAQLPVGATLGFDVVDPRLHHPLKTVDIKLNIEEQADLMAILASWPVDDAARPQALFDHRSRILAARQLPSQKSINRRKGEAPLGSYPSALPSDPRIPIIAYAEKQGARGQGCWVIMMPWKCVLPVWYSLMFYPLSTGGTIRFGGLQQTRQLAYEAGVPWFPGDFPGTDAGRNWELHEQKKRRAAWESRPKGRRIEWESVDLRRGRKGEVGIGWACDWDCLRNIVCMNHQGTPSVWRQLSRQEALKTLRKQQRDGDCGAGLLAAVKITMLHQGVVHACARIYRLPTTDLKLREQWKRGSGTSTGKSHQASSHVTKAQTDDAANVRRQHLAAMLLGEAQSQGPGEEALLAVPDEADLIGFVSTGDFNLAEGLGTSIGSIALEQVVRLPTPCDTSLEEFTRDRCLCIVRESGHGLGRLARWEFV